MEVSSGGHLRYAMIGRWLEKVGEGSVHAFADIGPAMQRMEPTMTKQKKTIAKPARAGTKARKQPAV